MTTNSSARPEQSAQPAATAAAISTHTDKPRFGVANAARVLDFLYHRADRLNAEELKFLSGSSDAASHLAGNLADVVSGIGCLVSWDDQEGKMQAGNFREGNDVSSLLFMISEQVALIGTLSEIGSESSFALLCKERGHV